MRHDVYGSGGWSGTSPNNNRTESWDLGSATYTRWSLDGTVAETRVLTGEETARLQALADGQTAAHSVDSIAALVQQAITDDDTYLALPSPTPADQLAQIRRLTRQMLAVARYLSATVPQSTPGDTLSDVSDVLNP